ncbi:MAG: MFS transporter [Burkholderiaceae bacterium]|nr:MFS transporter [Burkholderiaceae bacterium]
MSARATNHAPIVSVLMLAVATVGATLFAMSPLLPDIARAFGVPVSVAGTLPGAYSIALAIFAPVFGLTAQSLPRARVISAGLATFGSAWLIAVFTEDFASLMAFTVLAGAATGAALPSAYAYATDLSAPGDRARVLGRIVSGWSIAVVVVVPAMAVAAQSIDWRWAFGALGACALVLALRLALMPHPGEVGERRRLDADAIRAIGADLAQVARHARTRRLLAVNALDMGAFYAVYSYLGAELRSANDWDATPSGLMFALYGVGMAIVTFNAGWIDRRGARRVTIGALLTLCAMLAAIPWLTAIPAAMAVLVLGWGCLQGAFFTANTSLASEQIPALRGVVIALLSGSTFLGVALYSPLAALLYDSLGYPAVGLLAAAGCAVAAALLRARGGVPAADRVRGESSG